MSDIFVSYASEDRARAMAISKALEAEGWSVWWDRNIPAGKRFSEVIEEEIGIARCVVVLWSAVSVKKDWVVEEAENGKNRGVLVPIFVEPVQPPWGFRRIEAADLCGWRAGTSDTAFRALCQSIASVAGAPAVVPAAAAAPGTQRVQEARDVDRGAPRQEPPTVPPAPEGWRKPRVWMIAGALGLFAVGTTIYLIQTHKGARSKQSAVIQTQPPAGARLPQQEEASKKAPAETSRSEPPKSTPSIAPPLAKGTPAGRQTHPNPKDGLMYVYIEPGRFMMGCSRGDSECNDDERPAHRVNITKAFWLGQTPVTQEAYQRVTGTNPSVFKGPRLPVERVTWDKAQTYCRAVGMRLPTEAEWEYAARAGSTGARYGNLDQIAWYSGNSGSETHEVAQKQPNEFGLYDMLGNVWQWVADWYDESYYGHSPAADPAGPARETARVMRGGSWESSPRASNRRGRNYVPGRLGVGFRCAGELR